MATDFDNFIDKLAMDSDFTEELAVEVCGYPSYSHSNYVEFYDGVEITDYKKEPTETVTFDISFNATDAEKYGGGSLTGEMRGVKAEIIRTPNVHLKLIDPGRILNPDDLAAMKAESE